MLARALLSLPLLALLGCSGGDIVVGKRDAPVTTLRGAALPIGIENVNGSALTRAEQHALLRFVPDRTIDIDRLYFGFKTRGAACWDPEGAGNGAGDGGVLHGALVAIDEATGVPGAVLDEESVPACERHLQAEAEANATPVLGWVEVSARLVGGQMYGLLLRNDHAEPENNFFSFQTPIADTALAGPQARNELDAQAGGSLMSLDPREHVAWSLDAGESWRYGSDNGEYASFIDDDDAHPATRIPQYGFRLTDGTTFAPQPYYAYKNDCSDCTVLYSAARYARTFTELGGFIASGNDVGTLTITNLTTDVTASCTPELGYGFRTCMLPQPLAVAVGDDYTIHATGAVELLRMDEGQRAVFPSVGTPAGEHRASQPEPAPGTDAKDVPSLWAGPLSAHFPALAEK